MHYHLRQAHASKSHVSQMRASGFLLRSCMATGALLGDVILCPLLESYKKQACEASHLKALLLPEASDTSWKPANSTYDTSTCNLVQDQSSGKYFLSIWKLHEDFCKLFADGEKLPKKPSQWLRHVIKSQWLLTHGFPRGCWAVLIPKPLYAFVDETEHCNLSEFRPIISKRNTLAIMQFFFMERFMERPKQKLDWLREMQGQHGLTTTLIWRSISSLRTELQMARHWTSSAMLESDQATT